jgi:hypothetical protein
MRTIVTVLAVCLAFATSAALAADTPSTTRRGDQYHLAAAKTKNIHAHDHARLLGKYAAASDEPVPAAIVKEHAAAIRANAQQARKSYQALSAGAAKDPAVARQLEEINKRLNKVDELVERLESQSKRDSAASRAVIAETKAISQELKATHDASKEIDQAFADAAQEERAASQFDNRQSPDYYFTGEGHFID